jgi:hypothetical protein
LKRRPKLAAIWARPLPRWFARFSHTDAAWVHQQLAVPQTLGTTRILMHSIVWQYLSEETKAGVTSAMHTAAQAAAPNKPLGWLQVEADDVPGSARVSLTLWPGGELRILGRADYHGRWVDWA